jgi:uncharacterized protein YbjT (DUF2867 family)
MTKNDERTILVTGATGTVGSEVVKQLLAASSSSSSSGQGVIRAAVHSQNKADKFKRDNKTVDIVNIDYNKPETIADALNHVNKLFLVTVHSPNIVAAEISSSLIKEVKKNGGVKYIVKLSVMGADAEPATTIGRLHRQEEEVIEESGIPYTFLRPTSFMQNFVNIYGPSIKSKNAFYMPGGDAKVSFVDVRDIASVAARVLLTEHDDDNRRRHIGKAYNITGPEALSYYQAAEILSGATGKKISYVNISEADARRVMKDTGLDEWFINITLEQADNYRKGYASQLSDAVESITGNKPISFVQFAKDYAGAFS